MPLTRDGVVLGDMARRVREVAATLRTIEPTTAQLWRQADYLDEIAGLLEGLVQ